VRRPYHNQGSGKIRCLLSSLCSLDLLDQLGNDLEQIAQEELAKAYRELNEYPD
jgi:hypothetical protein